MARHAAARADSIAVGFNRRPAFFLLAGAMIAPRGFYDPTITDLGQYQVTVGLQWALRDGGARERERERLALEARSAAAELDGTTREIGVRAAEVALDLLRQQANESVTDDAVAWLDRLSQAIEATIRSGEHTPSDGLRVALEREAAFATLIDTRERRAALQRELAELIGRPEAGKLAVREPDSTAQLSPSEADSIALLARTRSAPAARAAAADQSMRRLDLEDARTRDATQVNVTADAGARGADLTSLVPPDLRAQDPNATFVDRVRRDLGASLTLEVKHPLTDRAHETAMAARSAALDAADLNRQAIEARSVREALDLLGRWHAAADRFASARGVAARAEESLLRLRALYAGGSVSLLELLDTRRQLDEARLRIADARLESLQARFEVNTP